MDTKLRRKVFMMTQKRKRYDRQFKIAAAQVVFSGDMTVRHRFLKEHRGELGPIKKACETLRACPRQQGS